METDKVIADQHRRKIELFTNIDEAFSETFNKFNEADTPLSFIDMYEAINMLSYKIRQMEISAFLQFKEDISKEDKKKSENVYS